MDINDILNALNLGNEPIDPLDLEYAIGNIRQSQQLNNMLNLQEAMNLRQEAIDRANNPGLANFYAALDQARIEGAASIFQ
jgi:hypothetical protein